MRISLLTIHPQIFSGFLTEGLIGKAIQKNKIQFQVVDLRDYSDAPHHRVDDKPYGGGPGMVLKPEPIVRALRALPSEKSEKRRVILMAAKGRPFSQKKARSLSKFDHLVFICGRYEGIDERVIEHFADEELRIGDYVLMGGEVAAEVVIEACVRLVPGVIGNPDSLIEESFSLQKEREYAQYTRPADFEGIKVPEVLIEGHHKKIQDWRAQRRKVS